MKHRNALAVIAFLLLTLLSASGRGVQAQTPPRKRAVSWLREVQNRSLPFEAGVAARRSAAIAVDASQFGSVPDAGLPSMDLDVFPDVALNVTWYDMRKGTNGAPSIWKGRVTGLPHSEATLVIDGAMVTGSVTRGDGTVYQIRTAADGTYWGIETDQSRFPETPDTIIPSANSPSVPQARDIQAATPSVESDDGSTIDVLVLYTPAARAAVGGTAQIQQLIQLGITETNTGYENSGVIQRVNLVRTQEINYTESSSMTTDLTRLQTSGDGFLDDAQDLRDAFGADEVSLWEQSPENSCGVGYQLTNPNAPASSFAPFAYNVMQQSCATGNYTFGHEMGHNMGANHGKDDLESNGKSPVGAYPYSNGFKQLTGPTRFRTIMAYDTNCSCPRIDFWSNPDVLYMPPSGSPGIPAGVDPNAANSAANYLSLNNTRKVTANYRTGVPPRGPVDTTAPLLRVTSYASGASVATGSIELTGTASDYGWGDSGIASVTVNGVRASGDSTTALGTANWSLTVNLNTGANVLTVVATDASPAQNKSTKVLTITRSVPVSATAATYHVFPQYADGMQSDGSSYRTTLMISNPDAANNVNCTLTLYGLTVNASSLQSYSLSGSGWLISQSPGRQALKSGYATLQCTSKVEAQLLYSYYAANGTKLAEATVFSSPSATVVQILGDSRGGSGIGLAIANDSDVATSYNVAAFDSAGLLVNSKVVALAKRSSSAVFVDELFALPLNYYGQVSVTSNVGSSIIGLRYTGPTFTTIPETTRSQVGATASAAHVFPQYADGVQSDGTFYRTTTMLSNPSSSTSANCTMTLHGLTVNNTTTVSYNMGPSGWINVQSPGTQAFKSGYASLSCNVPVEAQLLYSFYSATGVKNSEATVFSSTASASAQVLNDSRESARLGLAFANDSDQAGSYTLSVFDQDGTLRATTGLTLSPRSAQAKFLDEIVAIPPDYSGRVLVTAQSGVISLIGLRFTGVDFTTIPAVLRDPGQN